jgi:hypothetical protein
MGIYGLHPEDRYYEQLLDSYLDDNFSEYEPEPDYEPDFGEDDENFFDQ